MEPVIIGKKYDKVAKWWDNRHRGSSYGLKPLQRAIGYCKNHRTALDVGCGSGGRMIFTILECGFEVTGVDVSRKMLDLARKNHPEVSFELSDINSWQTIKKFDLIVAWDSIFHLPADMQEPVVSKLCSYLEPDGILIYTFGDGFGDHEDLPEYEKLGSSVDYWLLKNIFYV